MAEFIVLTGLSGAGRSEATKHLEDLGWYVIDNLPPSLVPQIADLARESGAGMDRVALAVGTGGRPDDLVESIAVLRERADRVRVAFLEARRDVLVRRYEATRRRHPLKGFGSLAAAIEGEREGAAEIRGAADVVIDTSDLNVHELRDRILDLFGDGDAEKRMQTRLTSFGYKHGVPVDADLVMDCRFLPNPHWEEELRPLTGLDDPVSEYVLGQPGAGRFLAQLTDLLAALLPAYAAEGKAYLTIAFGCTGGRHRSVAIAEYMVEPLTGLGYPPSVRHRDIER